ncbi:MAG TPA: hypothetical protein VEZ19_00230, partial [Rubrobacter sp.]|nr:hypothetical protein [Rubrobacter sp.]
MRRSILLVASVALAVLLASGMALAQEADTTPPETRLSTYPYDVPDPYENETNATFYFSTDDRDDSGTTFECKLDAGAYEPCTNNTKSYYSLTET